MRNWMSPGDSVISKHSSSDTLHEKIDRLALRRD